MMKTDVKINCIEMKHKAAAGVYEKIGHLSSRDLFNYLNKKTADLRKRQNKLKKP
jgi:hypothetical protein